MVGLHGRISRKIKTIFKDMLYQQYSFVYTEREFKKPACLIFGIFCFYIIVEVSTRIWKQNKIALKILMT